jgi:hypothetical protein
MARAAFNVLVSSYRRTGNREIEYALMKKAYQGFWQGSAGVGEDQGKPLEVGRHMYSKLKQPHD